MAMSCIVKQICLYPQDPLFWIGGEWYCHVDVEGKRKHRNRMIPVYAVAGKSTKIAVGNNHEEPHVVLPHLLSW